METRRPGRVSLEPRGEGVAVPNTRLGLGECDETRLLLPPVRSTDSALITTSVEAVAPVEAVNHPNFKLMVDYSFLRIQKDDLNALIKARDHLRNVHIANPQKNRTYPMDESESDYASFFRVLKQIGYRGGISVHAATQNFSADAPRAIVFLRAKAADLAAGAER